MADIERCLADGQAKIRACGSDIRTGERIFSKKQYK